MAAFCVGIPPPPPKNTPRIPQCWGSPLPPPPLPWSPPRSVGSSCPPSLLRPFGLLHGCTPLTVRLCPPPHFGAPCATPMSPPPITPHSLSFHCLWLRPPHRDPHDPPSMGLPLYPPIPPRPHCGVPHLPPSPPEDPSDLQNPPTPTQLPSPPPHEPQGGSACTPLSLRGGNTGTGGAPRDPKPPSLSPRGSQGRGYGDGPIEGTRWPSRVLVPLAL